jgi:hypothetical protein
MSRHELQQQSTLGVGVMTMSGTSAAPWRAFGLLAVGVFLSVLDLFTVSIAFPAIQAGPGAIRRRSR